MSYALAALAIGGVVIGWLTRAEIHTFDYRLEDDEPRGDAWPTWVSWWPVAALAVLWPAVGAALAPRYGWASVPAYLLLAWLAVVLVWIDSDVHRLPNGLTYPAYPALFGLLLLASLVGGDSRWLGALFGAGMLVGVFGILWLVSRGQVGLGDVKFAGVVGLALGWLGLDAVVVGTMTTFLAGGVSAGLLLVFGGANRSTPMAYGPSMCVGAFVAILSGVGLSDLLV